MTDVKFRAILLLASGLISASMISGCAATGQMSRYASADCAPTACAPVGVQTRYAAPIAHACCYAPPVQIVERVKTVEVEKPVYVDREKIVEVEVEKIVYVDKPVYVEVPAEPVVCCAYPEPPVPAHPHYPKRK